MPEEYPGINNLHLDAVEHGDTIVFLHAVRPGPANQSYGLQVATLAGVPKAVILRARERLRELEQNAQHHAELQQAQMPLFDLTPPEPVDSKLEALLGEIDVDGLTPREALDALYRLKDALDAS